MEISTIILSVIILLVLGILIFIIIGRKGDKNKGNEQDRMWQQQLLMLQQQHEVQMQTLQQHHARELSEIRETYRREAEENRKSQQAFFEASAAKLLKQNTQGLTQANNAQIEALLEPLRQKISDFSQAVNKAYVDENAARRSLSDRIEQLMKVGMTIGEDARNLTSALKGNSKVQGDWGEMVLEELLQSCGLTRGYGYEVQVTRDETGETLRDESGRAMRPDVVVFLPDDHKIVIDSKVSLTAYVDNCNASDPESQREALKRHIQSVRSHIDELDKKEYHRIKGSADYVMMFIPNEGAYIAAVHAEPTLWKYAFDRHVVLVSPTHLYSVVSLISQMWRQDAQNKNAMEIADRGGRLYDKLAGAMQEFQRINTEIKKLAEAYQIAEKRLYTGSGSVVSQAQKLRELGVKVTKHLDGGE